MNTLNTDPCLLVNATRIALLAHGHARRKDGQPFVCLPAAVWRELVRAGIGDPHLHALALVHDVLEESAGEAAVFRGRIRDGLGAPLLLACSSTSQHATQDLDAIARDLRKLAMLAVPMGIKVAYEGLSWGRTINEFTTAWDVVCRADAPNLGLGLDSFHAFATKTSLDDLELIDPRKIFLVQLADFMWQEIRTVEERISTARTFRVFPGEGVHSEQVADLVMRLAALGYRGDYSFEVFNDDYQQMPLPLVAQRARRSAEWLGEEVLRRSVPLPNRMTLRAP